MIFILRSMGRSIAFLFLIKRCFPFRQSNQMVAPLNYRILQGRILQLLKLARKFALFHLFRIGGLQAMRTRCSTWCLMLKDVRTSTKTTLSIFPDRLFLAKTSIRIQKNTWSIFLYPIIIGILKGRTGATAL
ncbi:hypothetical protein DMP08_10305 [Paraeggerthella hongkongensis]|uniref:Uncharacterized protein n=1 Tax=Paraeggerthella hongkongensis TaxID=230658 RepID=A0A3N0B0Q5_9ACTN|nr:hypothetical protein DMP08_10305 [Paraeggerthella hongkongensis]